MKRFFALILFSLLGTATFASDTPQTVRIKTSAICKMCKARIERQLGYTKGVTDASLDLKDKVVTVTYNPRKTSPDQLRRVISEVGYDADGLPANQKSHDKLPKCCRKGTPDHAD